MNARTMLRDLRGLLMPGSLALCATLLSCNTLEHPEAPATRSIAPRVVFEGPRPYTAKVRVIVHELDRPDRVFFEQEYPASSSSARIPGLPTSVPLQIQVRGLIEDGAIVWSASSQIPPGTDDKYANVSAQASIPLQTPSIAISEIAGVAHVSFSQSNGRGEVYYTTDATTPLTKTTGIKYLGSPVKLTGDGQIKARVYDFSSNPPSASDIVVQPYSSSGPTGSTDNLWFDQPIGHTAAPGYQVSILHNQTQYSVWYTTDGSDPQVSANAFVFQKASEVFVVNAPLHLRAVAMNSSRQVVSNVLDGWFYVTTSVPQLPEPTFSMYYPTSSPLDLSGMATFTPASVPFWFKIQREVSTGETPRILYTTNGLDPAVAPDGINTFEYLSEVQIVGPTMVKAHVCTYVGVCGAMRSLEIRDVATVPRLPQPTFSHAQNTAPARFPLDVQIVWPAATNVPPTGSYVFRYSRTGLPTESDPVSTGTITFTGPGAVYVMAYPANGANYSPGDVAVLTVPDIPVAWSDWSDDPTPPMDNGVRARINDLVEYSGYLYAATSNGVWRRPLPEGSWTQLMPSELSEPVQTLALQGVFLFAGTNNGVRYTATSLLGTANGRWNRPLSAVPSAPVSVLAADPDQGVYAVVAGSVWRADPTNYQTWVQLGGLPSASQPRRIVFIDSTAYLATADNVFSAPLGTGAWSQVGVPPYYPLHDMATTGASLYIAAGASPTRILRMDAPQFATASSLWAEFDQLAPVGYTTVDVSLDVGNGHLFVARTFDQGSSPTTRVDFYPGLTLPASQVGSTAIESRDLGDVLVTPYRVWVGTGAGVYWRPIP